MHHDSEVPVRNYCRGGMRRITLPPEERRAQVEKRCNYINSLPRPRRPRVRLHGPGMSGPLMATFSMFLCLLGRAFVVKDQPRVVLTSGELVVYGTCIAIALIPVLWLIRKRIWKDEKSLLREGHAVLAYVREEKIEQSKRKAVATFAFHYNGEKLEVTTPTLSTTIGFWTPETNPYFTLIIDEKIPSEFLVYEWSDYTVS